MKSVGTLSSLALALTLLQVLPAACKEEGVSGAQLRAASGEHDKPRGDAVAQDQDAPSTPLTAEQVFNTRCATCHGSHGRGDGPAAQALKPRPRDYTDVAWQKSVTDAHLKQAIIEGGASVGKSSLMGPNADLADKPEILNGLVEIIRGFSVEAPKPIRD